MRESTQLLHNMSAPPKSVVRYQGLSSLAAPSWPQHNVLQDGGFGAAVRFTLPLDWLGLEPAALLARLEQAQTGMARPARRSAARKTGTADAAQQLAALINQRAQDLTLPDGCAVIASLPIHPVLWPDPLAALAVLAKCTGTVWLRSKTPSLVVAVRQASVSLLVPPAFVSRLPPYPSSEEAP